MPFIETIQLTTVQVRPLSPAPCDRTIVGSAAAGEDSERRGSERSAGPESHFIQQYNAHKLLYFEAHPDRSAIAREKQLKNWSRKKQEAPTAKAGPEWRDLIDEMHAVTPKGGSR